MGGFVVQASANKLYWFSPATGYGEKLSEIKNPTLIVSGDRDPFFDVDGQAALFRAIPNVRLAVNPLTEHVPYHQHPTEVTAQIHRFLK